MPSRVDEPSYLLKPCVWAGCCFIFRKISLPGREKPGEVGKFCRESVEKIHTFYVSEPQGPDKRFTPVRAICSRGNWLQAHTRVDEFYRYLWQNICIIYKKIFSVYEDSSSFCRWVLPLSPALSLAVDSCRGLTRVKKKMEVCRNTRCISVFCWLRASVCFWPEWPRCSPFLFQHLKAGFGFRSSALGFFGEKPDFLYRTAACRPASQSSHKNRFWIVIRKYRLFWEVLSSSVFLSKKKCNVT